MRLFIDNNICQYIEIGIDTRSKHIKKQETRLLPEPV